LEDHHADDTMVYIHNKGSFSPTKENTILRRLITPAALSRECSHMPSSCNTCSFRFSPLPHPHSPGNMWAARCSYIKLLMDPRKFKQNMSLLYPDKRKAYPEEVGTGRYSAVHSHPAVSPCDTSTK
jgi:hypothetical protein